MPRHTVLAGLALVLALVLAIVRPSPGFTPSAEGLISGKPPGSALPVDLSVPGAGGSASAPAPRLTAAQTASILAAVDAPGRDLPAITKRLRLRGSSTVPETVNAAPPNYAVGTRHQFYIADLINKNYYTATATIKVVTAHAYWYVKDGYGVDQAALRQSAQYFDDHIYATNRRVFGAEPSPGIDNDPHITVLLAPIPGVNGYFSSADAYPRIVNPFSNQRKMIYIAARPSANPASRDNLFASVLAHEFQHMIHWNVHRDRDVWLDEGASEIAMYLNGYSPGNFDALFQAQPDVQLNAWAGDPGVSRPHYGASYLFLRYLMQRYGGEPFISGLIKHPGLGMEPIDSAVRAAGNPSGFEGAFKDWLIANTLNNRVIDNGRYAYAEGGKAKPAKTFRSYPATRSDSVRQYAADYIKLSGNLDAATIQFKGNATARVLAADPHSGSGYWYSNRRDSGDATLTRELDLTRTRAATLRFWTWYDIENTFDYAYVEASTDGGQSWATLKGSYTTTANPNGASYGNAWTGKSGVTAQSTAPARWVRESADLSPYAGKKVQIRFEYITDEGYNAPGMAIDDLSVPEIGWSDNAEADNGWNAQGFVRIGNSMPQQWYVALIENSPTPRVRQMIVDATGAGTLNLDGFGAGKSVRDATIVIAALAPKTTEPATYSVNIKRR
jgi:hypothetical protein